MARCYVHSDEIKEANAILSFFSGICGILPYLLSGLPGTKGTTSMRNSRIVFGE